MNTLHNAGQEWRVKMTDTDVVLKRKIMAWVKAVDEKEEEEEKNEDHEESDIVMDAVDFE